MIVSHGIRFVKNNHIILKLGDYIIVLSLVLNIRETGSAKADVFDPKSFIFKTR